MVIDTESGPVTCVDAMFWNAGPVKTGGLLFLEVEQQGG